MCHQNVTEPQAQNITQKYTLWVRSSCNHAAYRLVKCTPQGDRCHVIWRAQAPISLAWPDPTPTPIVLSIHPFAPVVTVLRVFNPAARVVFELMQEKLAKYCDLGYDVQQMYRKFTANSSMWGSLRLAPIIVVKNICNLMLLSLCWFISST